MPLHILNHIDETVGSRLLPADVRECIGVRCECDDYARSKKWCKHCAALWVVLIKNCNAWPYLYINMRGLDIIAIVGAAQYARHLKIEGPPEKRARGGGPYSTPPSGAGTAEDPIEI